MVGGGEDGLRGCWTLIVELPLGLMMSGRPCIGNSGVCMCE